MIQKNDLIAYAESFLSFLITDEVFRKNHVKEIVLFGSVARGDFDENSDIDLFINIFDANDEKIVEMAVERNLSVFHKSNVFESWKLRNIKNEIKCHVGTLEEWELRRSVVSEGILLYGSYTGVPEKMRAYVLFTFEPIKGVARRNRVIRTLFGRQERGEYKEGLVGKFKGKILTKTSFVVPISASQDVLNTLKAEKVDYFIFDIWTDRRFSSPETIRPD